jgi:uncharacterized membrane protein YciS (DUF1049 family)
MNHNLKLLASGFIIGFGIGVLSIGIADNKMQIEIDRLQKRCEMLQYQRDFFAKILQINPNQGGTNYTVVPVKGVN